jgi:membrane protein DedA with SNARE-associated domain
MKKFFNLKKISIFIETGLIFLGFWFFDLFGPKIISFYGLADEFVLVEQFFRDHAFWSVFISAFTPIPYKVFTVGAGLFHANFIVFLVASILGRGLRFIIVGSIFRYIGEKYSDLIFKYFNILSLLFGLLIIVYLIIKFI